MKFIDEANIKVIAGKGGDGVVSFRREAHVSRGGPDGGDGGNGGNVIFKGDSGINTLLNINFLKKVKAEDGQNGMNKNKYGRNGKDYYLSIPLGTLVYHNNNLIADIKEEKEYLIAKGGGGGRGNVKFKSARNNAPRLSDNGDLGEQLDLHLELQVLADIGFVGKPSAGKSQLLSVISNAKPKVASYSFTTLVPQLGLVRVNNRNSFVVADLPGLIKGASQGKGLGVQFLKHINRTKVIAHIIDMGTKDKNPIEDFKQIKKELKEYSKLLMKRETIIVANKSDFPNFKSNLKEFKMKNPKLKVIEISALKQQGIETLKKELYDVLQKAKPIKLEKKQKERTIEFEDDITIQNPYAGFYEVGGTEVKRIYHKIPLNTDANINRFNKKLKDIGLWDELKKRKIKDGDIVRIYGFEFEWWGDDE